MRIGQSWISPCIQFNCVSPYGRINGRNPDGSYGIPAMNFDETFARAQDYSGLVRERNTAFPCTSAAILSKTDAFACGAAGRDEPGGPEL